jgi:hypothetical protein
LREWIGLLDVLGAQLTIWENNGNVSCCLLSHYPSKRGARKSSKESKLEGTVGIEAELDAGEGALRINSISKSERFKFKAASALRFSSEKS